MKTLTKMMPESLRAKLVLFFMTILLWLALSNSLLIYLFVSYVREYNMTMETITLTNSINGGLIQELDSEIIDILYGKVSFNSGSQYEILSEMNQNLNQIETADKDGIFTEKIRDVRETLTTTKEYIDKLGEAIKYNRPAEDRYITYEYITIASDLIDDQVRILLQETLDYSEQSIVEIEKHIKRDVTIFGVIFIFVIFFYYLFAWYISGNIVKPIHLLRNKTNEIAKGNIQTGNIDINAKGEIGDLYRFSNQIIQNLKEIILNIRETTHSVSLSSQELLKSIQQNRAAAEKVANEIQSISGALHKQKDMVKQTSANIKNIAAQIHSIVHEGIVVNSLANESLVLIDKGILEISIIKKQMNKTFSLLEEAVNEIHSVSNTYVKMESNDRSIHHLINQTDEFIDQFTSSVEYNTNPDFRKLIEHINSLQQSMRLFYKQSEDKYMFVNYKMETILTQMMTIKNKIDDDYQILQVQKLLTTINANVLVVQATYSTLSENMQGVANQMDTSNKDLDEIAFSSERINSVILNVATIEQLISLEEVSEMSIKLIELFKQLEKRIEKFKV